MVNDDTSHIVRLSGTSWDAVLAAQRDSVATAVSVDIATALGIDKSRVRIDSLTVGSLVVGFTIVTNSSSQPQINSDGVTHLLLTQFSPASTQFVYTVTSGTTESVTLLETYSLVHSAPKAKCGAGCIVGIALGTLVVVSACVAVAVFCYRRRANKKGKSVESHQPSHPSIAPDLRDAQREFEPLPFPPTDPRRGDWLHYNNDGVPDSAMVEVVDTVSPRDITTPPFEMPFTTRIVQDTPLSVTPSLWPMEPVFRDDDSDSNIGDFGDDPPTTTDPLGESFSSSVLHISGDEYGREPATPDDQGWTPRKYPAHSTALQGRAGVFIRRVGGGGFAGIDPAVIANDSNGGDGIVAPPTAYSSRVRFADVGSSDIQYEPDEASTASFDASSMQAHTLMSDAHQQASYRNGDDIIHVVSSAPHAPTQRREGSDKECESDDGSSPLEAPFEGQPDEWAWEFAELPATALMSFRSPPAPPPPTSQPGSFSVVITDDT